MLSFFEADKREKYGDEDVLTSRFFGIIDIVNKKVVLQSILSKIGINLSVDEINAAQIRLWETYTDCIPDAIIETDSTLIFIESKLDASVSIDQLEREYNAGVSEKKMFYLICITNDFDLPREVIEIKNKLNTENIIWFSWQNMYVTINNLLESTEINDTEKKLLQNLLIFFEVNRLRGFKGFDEEEYKNISQMYEVIESFYNELSIFIGELNSILIQDGLILKRTGMTTFYRDGRGTSLQNPGDWISSSFTFAYGKEDWDFGLSWQSNYLFIRFMFWKPEIWAGYKLNINDPTQKNILVEKRAELFDFLKEDKNLMVVFDWTEEYEKNEIEISNFEEENIDYERIEFIYKIPIKEIGTRNLLYKVRDNIVSLKNMVENIGLLPKNE